MYQQGRGSAVHTISTINVATLLLLMCLVVGLEHVDAASFTVGDSSGWTFGVQNWPQGKRFSAGDELIFNYDPTRHDVVAVDEESYGSCRVPASADVYRTGKDQIKVVKGLNYFICSLPGHCDFGMKIAVNAV